MTAVFSRPSGLPAAACCARIAAPVGAGIAFESLRHDQLEDGALMMGSVRTWLRNWIGVTDLPAPPLPAVPQKGWRVSDGTIARARSKAATVNIFSPKQDLHPSQVTASAMAMDGAIGDYSTWAGGNFNGFEGEQFIGFPALAEMATRPEYRRASEVIARHMTRKWIKFQATGDEDKGDMIAKIETEMTRLGVKAMFQRAAEQDGYFGRAHMFLDFGDWDQAEELLTSVGTGRDQVSAGKCQPGKPIKRLVTIEAQWCYPQDYDATNPMSPNWYKPQAWTTPHGKIHGTRLLTFIGREVPDMMKPAYSFGGLSLSQMGKASVDNWLETRRSVNDAISAYSVMVFKTGMKEAVQGAGDAMFARAELMNLLRDNRGMIVVDKDSEDFVNISAPLGSLDALQGQAQEHCASVWGIPVEILNGIQPSGLNASSEGQVRIFFDTIHSAQEHLFRTNLEAVVGFVQLSLFGKIDDTITFQFEDLAALDDKEKADLELVKAQVDQINTDIGAVGAADVRRRLANDPDSLYEGLDPDDLPPAPGEGDSPPPPADDPEAKPGQLDPDDGEAANDSAEQDRADNGQFGSGSQIVQHVSKVMESKGNTPPLDLGPTSAKNIDLVKLHTGLDISGHRRSLDSSDIRHTFASHGDEKTEVARGQKPVRKGDFALIPRIVENAHKVDIQGVAGAGKGQRLGYHAKIGDHEYHYVEHLRPNNKIVALKSMRKS